MKQHQTFNEEELLSSIDQINRAEASPFLKTRLLAYLKNQEAETYMPGWVMAVSFSLVGILLISNLWLLTHVPNEQLSDQSDAEQFSQSYQIQSTQIVYEKQSAQ